MPDGNEDLSADKQKKHYAGSRIFTIRLSDEEIELVSAAIARRRNDPLRAAWTFSDFVRMAIREKIAHMARSRAKRRKPALRRPIEVIDLPSDDVLHNRRQSTFSEGAD